MKLMAVYKPLGYKDTIQMMYRNGQQRNVNMLSLISCDAYTGSVITSPPITT